MEKEILLTDKKFYIVMAVAVVALVIGAAGLIIGMMKPSRTEPPMLQPNVNGSPSMGGVSNDKTFQVNPDGSVNEVAPRGSAGNMEQPAR